MMINDLPSVLLLDCSKELESRLVRQGFDVESGEVGFSTGIRRFPKQIYEYDVIIYNPDTLADSPDENSKYLRPYQIKNTTPEFGLNEIVAHVDRGAVVLAFVKKLVADDQDAIRKAYSWIPAMPIPDSTSDTKIISHVTKTKLSILSPIVSVHFVKTPVKQKLPVGTLGRHNYSVDDLFSNLNNDPLGLMIRAGYGEIILLPDCNDNDEVINTFMKRVAPKILGVESKISTNLIDIFKSPEELKIGKLISTNKQQALVLESKIEDLRAKLVVSGAKKGKKLGENETVKQILKYYDLATEQPDVALHYLYKITNTLKNKIGNEKEAIKVLDVYKEWKYIGRVANASYGDMRHSPMPGEPVKEWSDEEIEKCFEYARKIVYSYFKTLFAKVKDLPKPDITSKS